MRLGTLLLVPVLACVCTLFPGGSARGAGEITAGVGGVWPQGSFAAYGDPGFTLFLRGELEAPGFGALACWADFNYVSFGDESFETDASVGDVTFPVDQTTSQYAVAAHIGLQLGSSSHKAFFRPRAAVGVGLYYFETELRLERKDAEDDEEPLYSESLDSQFRLGWRGTLGADFYFTQAAGVSFDLFYDHVFDLNRVEGEEEAHRTSVYEGFAVGVVFPFGSV